MSFLKTVKSTILITGGASGIGLEISKQFIALGHTVIAAGRRQTQLDLASAENPLLQTIQADVSTDDGRIALFEKVTRDFPSLNVVFHNAAIVHFELPPLQDSKSDSWALHKQTFATNLDAPFHLSMLFLPHLVSKPNALIINNTSMAAFVPLIKMLSYSVTKGDQLFLSFD